MRSLIEELSKKGCRVATVTWRDGQEHLKQGAVASLKVATDELVLYSPPRPFMEALELLPPVDYVLVEEPKDVTMPKVVVGTEEGKAMASWRPGEPMERIISSIDSLPAISVQVTIDDRRIPLKPYIQGVFAAMIKGFLSTLKGFDEGARVTSIKINLREHSQATSVEEKRG